MIRSVPHLLCLLSALAAGCRREVAAEEAGSSRPRTVRCVPAETRTLRAQVTLHGSVAPLPDRDAQIAPQVAGRIVSVLVREGDQVTRGQPLARIDDAALADGVQEAGAQLARARAEANLARTTRVRVERVFQRGIAARQELDDAEARVSTAEAGEIEARAAHEIARRQLDRATVRSPLAGVVLKLFRKSGELVDGTPATPVVEVGDPTHLELLASATAADLVRVHARDSALVEVPALPGAGLRGRVVAVSPAVDRVTGLGTVRVSLDTATGSPPPPVGVSGVVRIDTGAQRQATVVPPAALRATSGDQAEVVVCGPDGRAHVVRIRRGPDGETGAGGWVEVRPADPPPAAALSAGASPDAGAPAGAAAGVPPILAGTPVAVDPVLGIAEGDAIEPAR